MTERSQHSDHSETDSGCKALRVEARKAGVRSQEDLPFMLCPEGATAAALLVHGFTATPWEMRPLAEFLGAAGIASLAIRLPGHGTSPEDLAGRCWEEWQAAVIAGYQILSNGFATIYGMGMSTGCLLLLSIAQTHPFQALVLFSPYLQVQHRLAPYAGWLRWIQPYQQSRSGTGPREHYYDRRPVAGVHQINRLAKSLSRQLPHLKCPVLAFNGEGDQTVDIKSGRKLIDLMASPVKIYQQFGPEVPHILTGEGNPCRAMMFDQTLHFVKKLDNACAE